MIQIKLTNKGLEIMRFILSRGWAGDDSFESPAQSSKNLKIKDWPDIKK